MFYHIKKIGDIYMNYFLCYVFEHKQNIKQ